MDWHRLLRVPRTLRPGYSCGRLAAVKAGGGTTKSTKDTLEKLWLNGRYVAGKPDHDFYVTPEQDVLVMDWAGVWVGSPSRQVADLVAQDVKVTVLGD
jgi:hypothetical protein